MQQPNDYALVIGVSSYPNYQELIGPIDDAEAFHAWLTDTKIGGGLPKKNCRKLIDPAHPTGGRIDRAVRSMINQINKAKKLGREPRRLYLYFSGHGLSHQRDEIVLLLNEWSLDAFGSRTGLSVNGLIQAITTCIDFKEVAVFLDCCQSRDSSVLGSASICHQPVKNANDPKIFKAYSCRFLEKSYVAQQPTQPSTTRYQAASYFTIVLMEAFEGAAADLIGGGVSHEALEAYLYREVPRRIENQTPVVYYPADTVFVFGNAPSQIPPELSQEEVLFPITINFQPGRQGPVKLVLSNGDEKLYPDLTHPLQLPLPKGLYELNDQSNPASSLPFRIPRDQNVTF